MYNPFDLIPQTIDKNLRNLIIGLICIQLTAFFILIGYLTYEFICHKLDKKKNVELSDEFGDETEKVKAEGQNENSNSEVKDLNNREKIIEKCIEENERNSNINEKESHLKQD